MSLGYLKGKRKEILSGRSIRESTEKVHGKPEAMCTLT